MISKIKEQDETFSDINVILKHILITDGFNFSLNFHERRSSFVSVLQYRSLKTLYNQVNYSQRKSMIVSTPALKF